MDNFTEVVASKSSSGKFKKFLPFILIGAAVGGYAYLTKDKSVTPDYLSSGTEKVGGSSESQGIDTSGLDTTALYTGINAMISDNNKLFTEQLLELKTQFEETNQSINYDLGSLSAGLISTNDALVKTNTAVEINKSAADTGIIDTRSYVSDQVSAVSDSMETPAAAAITTNLGSNNLGNNGVGYDQAAHVNTISTIQNSIPAYVTEQKRVEAVVAARTEAALPITKQVEYLKEIQAVAPVNLGNNGIGYNEAKSNTFEANLKTDTSAKAKEIARVNDVITNRKAQGMDTSAQFAYLNKIT